MPHDLFGTPVIAAPMAGGTSTPAFVEAVHRAGGLGFLAAGYKSVPAMQAEIRTTRESGARFGMNVFLPDPAQLPPSAAVVAELEDYRLQLLADARRYGVELPQLRLDDDDEWQGKIDALLEDPVELVSFVFGLPGPDVVRALQRAGSAVLATVTTAAEAVRAAEQGVDALVVQHTSAGAHSAAFLQAQGSQPGGAARDNRARRRSWSQRYGPPSTSRWWPRAASWMRPNSTPCCAPGPLQPSSAPRFSARTKAAPGSCTRMPWRIGVSPGPG